MKLKNILFSLVAIILSFFATTVNAETTAPSSFTVDADEMYMLYGYNYLSNSTIKFTYN